jgi:hypothetical protein
MTAGWNQECDAQGNLMVLTQDFLLLQNVPKVQCSVVKGAHSKQLLT